MKSKNKEKNKLLPNDKYFDFNLADALFECQDKH